MRGVVRGELFSCLVIARLEHFGIQDCLKYFLKWCQTYCFQLLGNCPIAFFIFVCTDHAFFCMSHCFMAFEYAVLKKKNADILLLLWNEIIVLLQLDNLFPILPIYFLITIYTAFFVRPRSFQSKANKVLPAFWFFLW